MTPEIEARLSAIEERLKAVEAQQTLIMSAVQELGQQVGLLLTRLSQDGGQHG